MIIDPSDPRPIAFGIAFLAGLLSFLSPCVLPLVPAYLGYLSGATVAEGRLTAESRWVTLSHAFAFVVGFTALFIFVGAWLGIAQWIVQHFAADSGAAVAGFDFVIRDVLIRVGSVLLAVMAVRVADSPMSGDWRLHVGGTVFEWPGTIAGIPQKYVRWLIVGVVTAFVYNWLVVTPPSREVLILDVLLLAVLPLAGSSLSSIGALLLGLVAAVLNTWSWIANPINEVYATLEWGGVALQAVLIIGVVYYVSRTTLFYQEKRFEVSGRLRNKGYITSGVMGAVFGAGWTPCTGPNLMVILALAGSAGSVVLGTTLLTTYALGLGLPFLMVGLAFGAATTGLRRLMPYMTIIKAVNTALLLFMAALILSGRLQTLASLGGFDLGRFGEI